MPLFFTYMHLIIAYIFFLLQISYVLHVALLLTYQGCMLNKNYIDVFKNDKN